MIEEYSGQIFEVHVNRESVHFKNSQLESFLKKTKYFQKATCCTSSIRPKLVKSEFTIWWVSMRVTYVSLFLKTVF